MLRQAISKKRKWFLLHLVQPRDEPLQNAIWPNLDFMASCHHPTWRAKKPYLPQSDFYPICTRPVQKPFWALSVPKAFYIVFSKPCSNPIWPNLDFIRFYTIPTTSPSKGYLAHLGFYTTYVGTA